MPIIENFIGAWLGDEALFERGTQVSYPLAVFSVPSVELHAFQPPMMAPEPTSPATVYVCKLVEQPGPRTRDGIRVWVEAGQDDEWIWREYEQVMS